MTQAGPQRAGVPSADQTGPLTGQNFLEWSDRLRDVEEMMEDPELRAEAATIRDRAKTRLRRIIYGILSLGWRGSARIPTTGNGR